MKPYFHEIKFKRDTAFRKQFFVPESFVHPAKMDAQLLIWIVERYTHEGEFILDPMAGSGTTMLACTLGRNVVLVELEKKFCKMMRDNWELVRMRPQLGYDMGLCDIKQGDARDLVGLFAGLIPKEKRLPQQIDKCIFSPPYAEAQSGGGIAKKGYQGPKHGPTDLVGKRSYMPENIGGKDNISNLPYGSIDKIVTSPPYAEVSHHSDDPAELEHLRPGRSARVSGTAGEDESNIGQLPYGSIDKIVTSPPYEGSVSADTGGERIGHQERRAERLKEAGYEPKDYMGGHGRNLQQDWTYSVDAVVTSPPYEGAMEAHRHPPDHLHKAKHHFTQYGESNEQIGNLKSASYLEAMLQVYAQCWSVLKDGGLMILVTKNFIRNKQVVRLDTDTIKLCGQAGFTYLERHYRKLPSQSFWRVIYHQKHPEVEQIEYEDVLVFQCRE